MGVWGWVAAVAQFHDVHGFETVRGQVLRHHANILLGGERGAEGGARLVMGGWVEGV